MPELTIVKAIRLALEQEMEKDEDVILLGEDIGTKGGVFNATVGLIEKYGKERVLDTPLNESGIIGFAAGLGVYGLKAVAEIQFIDFIFPGFDQLQSEVSKMRHRSGGQFSLPITIRSPYGGGTGGAHYHSQSPESFFAHTPGLKVVVPSNPYDAKGLLTSSIRDPDPVIFMEPKRIYYHKGEVPEAEYTVPLSQADVVRQGEDVTLISYGAMLHVAKNAAEELSDYHNVECDVIDLRTVYPYDLNTIEKSVKKTGRVVSVTESPKTSGFGAEISALVAERWIEYMEGPIKRVAGYDVPFPFVLEHDYLPTVERVVDAVMEIYEYW